MNRSLPTLRLPLTAFLSLALMAATLAPASHAQKRRGARRSGVRAHSVRTPRNVDISRMLAQIDARNIERIVRRLVSFGTRNTMSEQDNPSRGIGAARDWLYQEFQEIGRQAGGRLTVELQSYVQEVDPKVPRITRPTRITNVVATLRGTQPQSAGRLYVVSGHYDSMCSDSKDYECDAPGANDDASGVAAVVEIARVMSKRPFDATIIFMAVAGEEQSLLGSTYFAEQARQKDWNIEAMLTNDIIGSSTGAGGVRDPWTVRVFSEGVPSNETEDEARTRKSVGGENDSSARQLGRFIKEAGERYVPGMRVWHIYRRDRYLRGGDHIPFLERGYAAVRFSETNENYNHQHQNVRVENGTQYGDLPEFNDYAYIARVARVNAAALASLALAPAKPREVRILTRQLTNDTELQWAANTEPDLAGYEIVWRDTTADAWTNSRPVGNVTTFTMRGMSKDNYFFGVRAVDRDGNRSPVTYPRPLGR